jgi:drug/metabolite transporter (DMT)-like permease
MRINPSDGHRPSRSFLVACITLIMAIWAVNYLAVKFALRFFQPLTLASFRVVAASIFMLAIYPIAAPTNKSARSATSSPSPISVFSVSV